MKFEDRQLSVKAKIMKMAQKAPDFTNFVINDKRVSKKEYVEALKAEGAHKLPFAYSKHTVTFYLLTPSYLKENKEEE